MREEKLVIEILREDFFLFRKERIPNEQRERNM